LNEHAASTCSTDPTLEQNEALIGRARELADDDSSSPAIGPGRAELLAMIAQGAASVARRA
jgi:hypothetical protein